MPPWSGGRGGLGASVVPWGASCDTPNTSTCTLVMGMHIPTAPRGSGAVRCLFPEPRGGGQGTHGLVDLRFCHLFQERDP